MMRIRACYNPYCAIRFALLIAIGCLLLGPGSASAQDYLKLPDTAEINLFAGGSWFNTVDSGLGTKHVDGGSFGARGTYNFHKYLGLEGSYTYKVNNLRFLEGPEPGDPAMAFGNRIHIFALNPVVHFTEKGSKVRPFVTAGVAGANFTPTDITYSLITSPPYEVWHAQALKSDLHVMLNYGGGLKFHLSPRFGLRFDLRGTYSKNPTYGFPSGPPPGGGVWIPTGDKLHGLQATAGVNFYLGAGELPPPPPPPAAPPPPPALLGGGITGMEGLLCQGRAITLKSDASDPAGRQLSYRWRLNGQPAGTNAPTFSFTPDAAGNYTVQVEVVDSTDASRVASAGPVTLNVREYRVPTATCSAQPTSLKAGDTSNLSATGTASACSSIASYKWSVTEGSVSNPTSPTTTFNSKGVTFQPTARIQTKSVTATATVADDRGATATCTASVQVQFTPTMARFGDIIFAKNGSRVNNCGKRILLEEVAAKAADPDYEIILIGHIDQDEAKRRPVRGRTLDQDRAFNAAAVLTGGTGTCGKIDLSRVRVDWVGTEQTADFQPGLCGTAARAATEERSGSQVTSADQNRRVEVWLVPRGTPMPPSVKGLKVLPEDVMKKLGCPK